MEWMLRQVWKLYPRGFRERFGRELERDLALARARGRRVGVGAVADAVLTLVRAWGREVTGALAPGRVAGDVGLAVRTLGRSPGYALVVVAILALALGANTAVFSVTHAVLLRALPYGSPQRVHSVQPAPLRMTAAGWSVQADFTALPQVEAAALFIEDGGANLTRGGSTDRVSLAQVTSDFFRVLDVQPLFGRSFDGGEDARSVVLSHALWVRAFGADPRAVDSELELNGEAYRVIGIMPAEVGFPGGTELWLPFPAGPGFYGGAFGPSAIALLREGADRASLQEILEQRVASDFADYEGEAPAAVLRGLREELTGSVRTPLLVLLGISGLVVLLGCLNLAGLVMSRTSGRLAELTLRRALGAGRARLFSQLFAEVMVLSVVAGVVGLATAQLTTGLLTSMLPAETPGLAGAGVGGPVMAFAAAVSACAGLLIGTIPSLRGAWVGERPEATRTSTDDPHGGRAQAMLVVGQVALALVLVTGASLLGRSLYELQRVPLGYDLDHVLTFQVRLPDEGYTDAAARSAYLSNALAELRRVPGVSAVGATSFLPRQEAMGIGIRLVPDGMAQQDTPHATWIQVTAGYFDAMGIRALAGEPFSGGSAVPLDNVVVSEALAAVLFPQGDAMGGAATVHAWGDPVPTRITAVVRDVSLRSRQAPPARLLYTPLESSPTSYFSFAVRADGDPTALVERVREVMLAIDPTVPPYAVGTTAQAAAREIATQRAVTLLSRLFSGSALLLTALGLYGLVGQSLARRRREMGIRLVMGARAPELVRAAMRRPLALTLLGLLIGVVGSLPAASLLAPLLFEVPARDPVVFGAVIVGIVFVAAVAVYLPARRVLRLDPCESLRVD